MAWLNSTRTSAKPGWKAILGLALAAVAAGGLVFFPLPLGQSPQPAPSLEQVIQPVPVDLNTATLEQLMLLEGVGPAKAQAIVEWRQQNGPFTSWEDVDQVKGISLNMIEAWNQTAVISQ